MVESGDYNTMDPKTTQIMALTTRLQALKKSAASASSGSFTQSHTLATNGTATSNIVDGRDQTLVGKYNIEKWRTIKTNDEFIIDGGKKYWFCKFHKVPGPWYGLWVMHEEKDHKDTKNRRGKFARGAKTNKPSNSGTDKLVIGQRLKEVLCRQLMMNDTGTEAYCEKVVQGKD